MKYESLILDNNIQVKYVIGQDAHENTEILQNADENDYWFHAELSSSCHVIANVPASVKTVKKWKTHIIKKGALLCKQNTNSIKTKQNVSIMYSKVKNVVECEKPGQVIVAESNNIII